MNIRAQIGTDVVVNMTSKGQVLIPKALRDRVGLVPGGPVRVRMDSAGRVLVSPIGPDRNETQEERRARARLAIESIAGKYATGQSTDEIMRELRGDFEP